MSINQWLVRQGVAIDFEPFAHGRYQSDELKAVSPEGKKLSGAAKNSFMQRARVLPAAQADSNPFTTRGS
jgi:hypothetical protein